MRTVAYSKTIYVNPHVIEGVPQPGKYHCSLHLIPDHYSHSGSTFMAMFQCLKKDVQDVRLQDVSFCTITESPCYKYQPLLTFNEILTERQLMNLSRKGWSILKNVQPSYRY